MARTKRVVEETDTTKEVLMIQNDSVIEQVITDQTEGSPVFRKGSAGSVDTHLVYFNGHEKWLTANAIRIAIQSHPELVKFPEGSLYEQNTSDIPCKSCGK